MSLIEPQSVETSRMATWLFGMAKDVLNVFRTRSSWDAMPCFALLATIMLPGQLSQKIWQNIWNQRELRYSSWLWLSISRWDEEHCQWSSVTHHHYHQGWQSLILRRPSKEGPFDCEDTSVSLARKLVPSWMFPSAVASFSSPGFPCEKMIIFSRKPAAQNLVSRLSDTLLLQMNIFSANIDVFRGSKWGGE